MNRTQVFCLVMLFVVISVIGSDYEVGSFAIRTGLDEVTEEEKSFMTNFGGTIGDTFLAAQGSPCLLITGKTGTGKSVLAPAIARKHSSACTTIRMALLEDEKEHSTPEKIVRTIAPLLKTSDKHTIILENLEGAFYSYGTDNDPDKYSADVLAELFARAKKNNNVKIIATSLSPQEIPVCVRKLFDFCHETKKPSWKERRLMFEQKLGENFKLSEWKIINSYRWNYLLQHTEGWNQRLINGLIKNIQSIAYSRVLQVKKPIKITWEDCKEALERMKRPCPWYFFYSRTIQATFVKILSLFPSQKKTESIQPRNIFKTRQKKLPNKEFRKILQQYNIEIPHFQSRVDEGEEKDAS